MGPSLAAAAGRSVVTIHEALHSTRHHGAKRVRVGFDRGDASPARLSAHDVACVLHLFLFEIVKEFSLGQLLHRALVLDEVGAHLPVEPHSSPRVVNGHLTGLVEPLEHGLGPFFAPVE